MCVFVYVYMFIIHLFSLLIIGETTQDGSSECKIDRAEFTDCMSFLQSNLMEEIRRKYLQLCMNHLKAKNNLCIVTG